MLMDMNGMILNESRTPTIDNLEMFLMQYPNFRPVLNMNNLGIDIFCKNNYDIVFIIFFVHLLFYFKFRKF